MQYRNVLKHNSKHIHNCKRFWFLGQASELAM